MSKLIVVTLIWLVLVTTYYQNVARANPSSQTKLIKIVRQLFAEQGDPLEPQDVKKMLKSALTIDVSRSFVEGLINTRYVAYIRLLDKFGNHNEQCTKADIEILGEVLKNYETNFVVLRRYIGFYKNQIVNDCVKRFLNEISSVKFLDNENNNWVKMRNMLHESGQDLEALSSLSDSSKDTITDVHKQFLASHDELILTGNHNWNEYKELVHNKYEKIVIKMCLYNGSIQLRDLSSFAPMKQDFLRSLEPEAQERVERVILCNHISGLDWDSSFDALMARRYPVEMVYNWIFEPESIYLEPVEVDLLLKLLFNYKKHQTGRHTRDLDNMTRVAELTRLPIEDPKCNREEIANFVDGPPDHELSNIQIYQVNYIPIYLDKCAKKLTHLSNLIRNTFWTQWFNMGFAAHIMTNLNYSSLTNPIRVDPEALMRGMVSFLSSRDMALSITTKPTQSDLNNLTIALNLTRRVCASGIELVRELIAAYGEMISSMDDYWFAYFQRSLDADTIKFIVMSEACKIWNQQQIDFERFYFNILYHRSLLGKAGSSGSTQ